MGPAMFSLIFDDRKFQGKFWKSESCEKAKRLLYC